ncbi:MULTISPECIES: hypothetical protein [unclassified Saccharothrix]|uniref:hypothetical protein n=1 Tax=unclassified Saccharothrix TaxID=2593673 RepID=UPI00307D7A22
MTPTGEATAYGVDYTARELMPWELAQYTRAGGYDLRFLFRPVGYPANPRCVTHQPGALARHRAAGRLVLLYHRLGEADARGGRDAGYGHALAAVTDAASEDYPDHLPLVFVLSTVPGVPASLAAEYLEGAASVAGFERTWCAPHPTWCTRYWPARRQRATSCTARRRHCATASRSASGPTAACTRAASTRVWSPRTWTWPSSSVTG